MEQNVNSGKKLAVFIAIVILASSVCAVWIAWFNDLIGFVPFAALGSIIVVNNALAGLVLGPVFLLILYPRIQHWGLLWTEIMAPDEVSASRFQVLGNVLMWIGGIGGLVVGLALGLGFYEQGFAAAGFAAGGAGGVGIGLGLIPFLILIIVASYMLGGREQVEAAEEELGSGRTR